jgi:ABC-2 type transport system permease protein
LVFGLYVAAQALAYATSYKTVAARRLLVHEFGTNVGVSALVGPARQIGTVPGYTAWKCLTVLAIAGSVWGILASTKLTRGEEDAGRWEVLLAGQVTRRGAAVQALVGLAAGAVALFVTTAVITVVVGRSSKVGISASGAIYFALAIVAGAAMFLVLGALSSQLASSRRQAAGYASALLGASYALRMVADSSTGLGWLRWVTPLGWVEEMQPLTRPNPLALVPISILIGVVGVLMAYLAGRRDLGSRVFSDRSTARPHLRLLNGPTGLALRLMRPTLIGWAASIIAYGLLLGGVAKSGGKIITSSPSLRRVFARLGVSGSEAYLGLAMLIMAMALSFIAVGQIGATRNEESGGQLENLLVRPVSRVTWLTRRVVLAAGLVVTGGLVVGLSTWAGVESGHAGVGILTMLGAGLNTVPPALVLLGVGVLAFGLVPRAAVALTYATMTWSIPVELLGGITNLNRWLLDSSAFHQMAAAPATSINWSANAIMVAIGAAAAIVGVGAFERRDLKGE